MIRSLVCSAAAVALAASCGASASVDADPVFALDRDAATDVEPVDPDRGVVVPAAQLQILLQALLTDHVTLSNEVMRSTIDGHPTDATLAELTANTDALTAALGLVYGPDGAHAFDQLWTNHIEFFNEFALVVRDRPADVADVRSRLHHYEEDFADFLARATDGNLALETALHVLHSHVDQMLTQAEAWAAGDIERSLIVAAEGFDHAAAIAAALAASIATQQPDSFPGDLADAAECVRAHLAARQVVTASAELVAAERSGDDARIAAAAAHQRSVETSAGTILGDATTATLVASVATFDDGGIAAARAEALLGAESAVATSCAT